MTANGYYGQQSGDLRATVAISQNEAAYGTSRTLNLPDGRTLQVTIPPNTRPGQEIRVEGHGQQGTGGTPAGALILTISIAQAENFGSQPYPLSGSDTPTAFMAPPPPPLPAQVSYPAINQGSGGGFTSYPPQGQLTPLPASYQQPTQSTPYYGLQGQVPVTPLAPSATKGRPRRSLFLTGMLAALAVLIIVGSLIYYGAVYQPQQQRLQATMTATARLQATNTAFTVQSTATVKAQANATATVIAKPLNDYNTITAKTPDLLNDSLSAPSTSNWLTDKGCFFKDGAYHAVADQKGFFYDCSATATKFSHFLYQVNMTFIKGNYGGIMFRADLTNSKFYLLRINGDTGGYDLYVYVGRQAKDSTRLLGSNSGAIKTGPNQSNKIAVLTRGTTIALYFNSTYIDSVEDTTIGSGQIAVFAEDDQNVAEVAFDHAQVWNA